jgi:hypothetical protein
VLDRIVVAIANPGVAVMLCLLAISTWFLLNPRTSGPFGATGGNAPVPITRRANIFFVVAIALLLCAYTVGMTNISPAFMSYSFAGMTVTYLYWYRSWRDWLAVGGGSAGLYLLYALRHPTLPFALVTLSGIAASICLLSRWALSRGKEHSRVGRIVALPMLVIVLSDVSVAPQMLTALLPKTIDNALLSADRLLFLGADPTYLAGGLALAVPHLRDFLGIWYLALGLGTVAVITPEALTKGALPRFVGSLVATGVCGLLIFCVLPAVGPAHAFAGYPYTVPGAAAPADGARNAFPSLHMSWAILMLLHARKGWPRWLGIAFVVMTVAATLGLGEHYCVDLLAAVPFTLGIDWLVRASWPGSRAQESQSQRAFQGVAQAVGRESADEALL